MSNEFVFWMVTCSAIKNFVLLSITRTRTPYRQFLDSYLQVTIRQCRVLFADNIINIIDRSI